MLKQLLYKLLNAITTEDIPFPYALHPDNPIITLSLTVFAAVSNQNNILIRCVFERNRFYLHKSVFSLSVIRVIISTGSLFSVDEI